LISAWLHTIHLDPSPLHEFLTGAQPANEVPMRIGRYAERLIQFFLINGPTHQLVAANIVCTAGEPTTKDHTTLGELDFLLRDRQANALHWELALKYFVANDVPEPNIVDYHTTK
jgi:uncharacterized protein